MPKMTPQQALRRGKTLTFKKVWVALMETREMIAETTKQMAEQIAELRKDTEQQIAEQRKETDRLLEEISRKHAEAVEERKKTERIVAEVGRKVDRVSENVGGLNRSMGELVETLLTAHLWEKFPQYGFTHALQRIPIYDENKQIKSDVDILLANTDVCMAVEVKRDLNKMESVDEHLKRLGLIRQYLPKLVDGSQLLGAMAGAVVDPDVKDYAHKSGLFVIELSGNAVCLVPQPEGFVPKQW
jgi:exonuclease VII large subunit